MTYKVYQLRQLGSFQLSTWSLVRVCDSWASILAVLNVQQLRRLKSDGLGALYQDEHGTIYKVMEVIDNG